MTPEVGLVILIGILAVAILIGVPIGFSLFLSSVVIILIDPGIELIIIPIIAMGRLRSFTLLAIPLFMYAAMLLNEYEFTGDIVDVSKILVGRLKAGLAHINVVASMLFAGVSGSSAADTAGIGGILIPVMIKKGYSKSFSAAITAASSTIGNIIPPSIMMVVYGATAEISVGALFIAGIIPGILVGISQMGAAYVYGVKYGWETGGGEETIRQPVWQKLSVVITKGFFPFTIFLIIIGGIIGGVFTATEAAAVAAAYTAIVGPLLYKRARSLKAFYRGAKNAGILAAITYFAIIGASVFAWLLSYYRAIDLSISIFNYFQLGRTSFLLLLALIYLILGTFLDPIPIIIIMTPLVLPIADKLHIHPLFLGIVSVMSIRIGTVTPPYGISMLVASGIAEIDPVEMFRDILIFTILFMAIVVLIILFPEICLLIPKLAMPRFA